MSCGIEKLVAQLMRYFYRLKNLDSAAMKNRVQNVSHKDLHVAITTWPVLQMQHIYKKPAPRASTLLGVPAFRTSHIPHCTTGPTIATQGMQ
jgi:hypothetical protein